MAKKRPTSAEYEKAKKANAAAARNLTIGVKPGRLKVLIVKQSDKGTDTRAIREADVVISGNRVIKHRSGTFKTLSPRELERVRAGDYAPLFLK